MIVKSINAINEADLKQLIETRTPEDKRLEYKRELPDGSDAGKVKFLRSVTAFANTHGGDLIYGMEAEDGVPLRLVPLSISSTDQALQRLEQLCADGVEPRLSGVQYRFVALSDGGNALVIRVAKSWNAPHRVTAGGHSHFYGRNAIGVYPLDVGDLRQAFTLSESVAERIRSFRASRLLALSNGDGPIPLIDGARTVLHIVPIQSLTSDVRLDVTGDSQTLLNFAPPTARSCSQRFNLDGRLTYCDVGEGTASSYALLFRSGIIEAAMVYAAWNGEKIIPGLEYEEDVIKALKAYHPVLQALGVGPPSYIFLSFLGVSEHRFLVDHRNFRERDRYADRDALIIPEIMVEDWRLDPASMMRPAFDMVWNAFGYRRSFNYDENGKWSGGRQTGKGGV